MYLLSGCSIGRPLILLKLKYVMARILTLMILVQLTTNLYSQKEDYNWVFGSINVKDYNSELNTWGDEAVPTVFTFNTDPPSFYQDTNITLDLQLTNAHYSDAEGNLLLYSNGMSIHKGDHQAVENGDTISFGPRWADFTSLVVDIDVREPSGFNIHNGAVFFKDPGSEEIYHLYTNFDNQEYVGPRRKLGRWFAKIDFNDNGDARVIEKDQVISDNIETGGFLKCAQHANGRDWWLVQHRHDTLLTYLIDPNGINLSHTQKIPFTPQDTKGGGSAYDPSAEQFALFQFSIADEGSEFIIMDFDRCSGMVSNERIQYRQDTLAFFTSGLEYSASGRYLYLCNLTSVFQYDTWADDIFATEQAVMVWDSTYSLSPGNDDPAFGRPNTFGLMQRGPDNKIYISGGVQGNYIHVIHNPDEPGLACNAEVTAIRLNTHYFTTMPNFNTLRLGPLDGSPCDTLGIDNNPVSRFRYEQDSMDYLSIDFVDLSYYEPTSWAWDFGDGNTSTERFPQHTYIEDDAYQVCLTVSNQFSTCTSCDTLYLGVSSLDDIEDERHITLFPNPVLDITRIAFHDYLPVEPSITLYDLSGYKIKHQKLDGTLSSIDLSAFPSGIYVYEIHDRGHFLKSGKVVKIE